MGISPEIIYQIPVLLLALCFHEMSHAWMANRLGDPTAKMLGRLTMNPASHIDPFGTVLFPLLLAITGAPVFGWAKPVPYNPRNLRRPGTDDAWIAAAGPLSNVLLALVGVVAFHLIAMLEITEGSLLFSAIRLFYFMVMINLILAFFNLIPVPPLDGGGILTNVLPPSMAPVVDFLRQYGFFIFVLLMFSGWTSAFISPAIALGHFLLGLG